MNIREIVGMGPVSGITGANAQEYLALPNVACVGGSWIAPQELLQSCEWHGIETLARDAAAFSRNYSTTIRP